MDKKTDRVKTGEFLSRPREQRSLPIPDRQKERGYFEELWQRGKERSAQMPHSYKKLLRNTAVCALLALGIWGIKSMDTAVTNEISQGIEQAVTSEMQMDEDIGRLKFVDSSSLATGGYSLPLEGEVITTFLEDGQEVSIRGEDQARVNAILSGTVAATGDDMVVINNDNGTRTTYRGVVPGVTAGDRVANADAIGQLAEEVLSLETVSSIGYVDSLDAQELASAGDFGSDSDAEATNTKEGDAAPTDAQTTEQ